MAKNQIKDLLDISKKKKKIPMIKTNTKLKYIHKQREKQSRKIENTIIGVCLTLGNSQYNATGSNSLAKELSRM